MKKLFSLKFIILSILNIFALYYLFFPIPSVPDLLAEYKSTEPGDTVQISNVKAFYTNMSRQDIIDYYLQNYATKHFFYIKINHPPERSKQIFRDTMQSYYLEEIIFPFKQSLYINGFEWENDVFTKPEKRIKNQLLVGETVYKSKLTLRYFPTTIASRLVVLVLLDIFYFFADFTIKKVFYA